MTDDATPQRGPRLWLWILWFLVASVVGFGALIGIGCAIGANACPFGEAARETSMDGEVIFSRNCAVCHGVDATGGQGGPSLLAEPAVSLTLDELEAKISRGRPFAGMPRFKTELSEAQISAVAGYLVGLRSDDPAASPSATEPGGTP